MARNLPKKDFDSFFDFIEVIGLPGVSVFVEFVGIAAELLEGLPPKEQIEAFLRDIEQRKQAIRDLEKLIEESRGNGLSDRIRRFEDGIKRERQSIGLDLQGIAREEGDVAGQERVERINQTASLTLPTDIAPLIEELEADRQRFAEMLDTLGVGSETFLTAAETIESASGVIELGGQSIAESARRLKRAADALSGGLGLPEPEFEEINATGDGQFVIPASFQPGKFNGVAQAVPIGSSEGASMVTGIVAAGEEAKRVNREIEAVTAATFARIRSIVDGVMADGELDWQDFRDVALGVIQDILSAQISGSGGAGGGIGDLLGSLLSTVFGGLFGGGGSAGTPIPAPGGGFVPGFGFGLASGGVAPAGKLSLVGEEGPELIMPNSPSLVLPNDLSEALVAGGGGNAQPSIRNNFTIDARGAAPGVEELIQQRILEAVPKIVQVTQNMILRSANRGGAFARMKRV